MPSPPGGGEPWLTRRDLLAGAAAGVALAASGCALPGGAAAPTTAGESVPLDSVPHERCWMAWPSSRRIWGSLLAGAQADIAAIARTIAKHEPVIMCANPGALASARASCGPAVQYIGAIRVDDCWIRDSGPVFTLDRAGRLAAAGLNFSGWGHKQTHAADALVASRVAAFDGVPFRAARFVSEGGAIETDGDGTLMATASSIVNRNRNPGMTRAEIEREMCVAYGARKVIWFPGISGRDITDDHVDATSRFVRPGLALVQVPPAFRTDVWAEDERQQARILEASADANGRRVRVIEVTGPTTLRSSNKHLVDSYVNYYVANGAVIAPQFGDRRADAAAKAALGAAFPGRVVEQLNIDALAIGGGGIHCVTQPEPVARA
jgi:agmatine deiminase